MDKEKKEYIEPKMEVLELKREGALLSSSECDETYYCGGFD